MKSFGKTKRIATLAMISGSLLWSSASFAHCDSLDGPVIEDARTALNEQSLKPVMKWIAPTNEKDLTAAFNDTLEVRGESPQARKLADKYFFETLVRLHRETEGAPYTGLKPAGSASAAAKAADRALAEGNVDALAQKLGENVTNFVVKQFRETIQDANAESVPDGRKFVGNYVRYVHAIEEIHNIIAGTHDEH
ncbi:DUF6448 family protein [Marinobacter sp. TBZ242]|uniref:DUF6448 family protein n=1 Tax=Marinobacter azerbaijanicus TaxID=3050455 RepID=A0ABT7IB47_9GAMM|nr:DUF6448 family protein [Marinobacter sp. TBZ242]MDL0431378.1 DUF6448 family protein [Marinobacter sp. TBZ242]